jgi:pilus assembly protein Flp/PilA
MKKLLTLAKQFRDEESGAAMVEYTILLGIITSLVILTVLAVGTYVSGTWDAFCSTLDSAGGVGCSVAGGDAG